MSLFSICPSTNVTLLASSSDREVVRVDSDTLGAGLVCLLAATLLGTAGGIHAGFIEVQEWSRGLGGLFWSNVTILGDFRILLALLLPISLRYPRFFLVFLAACMLAGLAAKGIKWLFPLPRPADLLDLADITLIGVPRSGHSFPSSHAATIGACLAACLAQWRMQRIFPLIFLALPACLSRVAVGAHWPVDVLVGLSVGLLAGPPAVRLVDRLLRVVRPKQLCRLSPLWVALVLSLPFDDLGYPASLPLRVAICVFALAGLAAASLAARTGSGGLESLVPDAS